MSKIVDRTLDFFELFAEHKRPLQLSEIARLLAIPVSSCHDVLQALVRRGYLAEPVNRGGFFPTERMFQIAEAIAGKDPLLDRAEQVIERLAAEVGETIALARCSSLDLRYILVRESNHQLRFSVTVGNKVRSLYATSAGKCLLGSLDESRRQQVIDDLSLAPLTPKTITDAGKLDRDLACGQARGWYLNDEESALDAMTLSAGFHWRGILHVLTAAGPKSRVGAKRDEIGKRLREACAEIAG